MLVFDTNILIHYGNQDSSVVRALEAWSEDKEPMIISTIVEAELLSWPELTHDDLRRADRILSIFTIFPIDSLAARTAAFLRRQYKTPLADSIIAATAFLHNAPLVTRNAKDFSKIREIEILKI